MKMPSYQCTKSLCGYKISWPSYLYNEIFLVSSYKTKAQISNEDLSTRNKDFVNGQVITSYRLLWFVVIYPCPRYLLLASKHHLSTASADGIRSSYLHHQISYTDKTASLHWNKPLDIKFDYQPTLPAHGVITTTFPKGYLHSDLPIASVKMDQ